VFKKFGEWYQKTNKTEDTNKLTLYAFKILAILHNTLFGNVHKASGDCQQRPHLGIERRTAVTSSWIAARTSDSGSEIDS
jgi:hypothetical protein